MSDTFGYDDGQGDVEVLPDSPEDSTFVADGLTSFPSQFSRKMIVFVTDGE